MTSTRHVRTLDRWQRPWATAIFALSLFVLPAFPGLFADGGEAPDVPVLASGLAVGSLAGLVMAFSGFFFDAPGSLRGPLADRVATWLVRLLAAAVVVALVVAGLALAHTDWSHDTTTATDDPSEQAVTYGLFVGVIIAAWALRSLRRRPLQAGATIRVG